MLAAAGIPFRTCAAATWVCTAAKAATGLTVIIAAVTAATAAAFAARHASAAEIAELEDLVADEEPIRDDPHKLAELNRLFHSVLTKAAHNRFLERALFGLRDSMALLGPTTLAVAGQYETAHAEHIAMVKAVANRDPEAAEAAARSHIRNAQRARLKVMREDILADKKDQ